MEQWKRQRAEEEEKEEEELDFGGDEMQVDAGSMLRPQRLVNTQLFEDVKTNKMRAAFLEEFRHTTADLPTRVWTEEAEIQVYQEELEQMKQADIFLTRTFSSFLKPEDDSCKGRLQRNLEDRVRRTRRSTSVEQSASRP